MPALEPGHWQETINDVRKYKALNAIIDFLSCDIFVLMPGRSITKTTLLLALIYSVIAEGYFCFIRITGTISLNGNHQAIFHREYLGT